MNNIYRIDTHNTHGWQVRVQRQKQLFSKFFPDSQFDTREAGRAAACAYRDRLLDEVPDPIAPAEHLHTPDARKKAWEASTRTGVLGIGFSMHRGRKGAQHPFVQGYWNDEFGERRSVSRSIAKWGLKSALWQVCMEVAEGMEKGQAQSYREAERVPEPWELFEAALPRLRELAPDDVAL